MEKREKGEKGNYKRGGNSSSTSFNFNLILKYFTLSLPLSVYLSVSVSHSPFLSLSFSVSLICDRLCRVKIKMANVLVCSYVN
jgi:hypothetical protein